MSGPVEIFAAVAYSVEVLVSQVEQIGSVALEVAYDNFPVVAAEVEPLIQTADFLVDCEIEAAVPFLPVVDFASAVVVEQSLSVDPCTAASAVVVDSAALGPCLVVDLASVVMEEL